MEPRYVLRTTSQYTWATILTLVALLILVAQILHNGTNGLVGTIIFAFGLSVFAIAIYTLPFFEVSPEGVVISNTFLVTRIPWPAFDSVNSRWGMRVKATNGRSYTVRVFGASEASRWQSKPENADAGTVSSYEPGHRIPRLAEGVLHLRATTLTATSLVEDLALEYSLAQGDSHRSVSRSLNIRALAVLLAGLLAMAGGFALLLN